MVNYGEKAPEIIFISAVIPPLQKYKFKPPEAVKVDEAVKLGIMSIITSTLLPSFAAANVNHTST